MVAHPDPSVELDCWIVPLEGGTPLDTGVMRRGRQQGLIVITPPPAWAGDSVSIPQQAGRACTSGGSESHPDLRRDWCTGGRDTGRRLRVLSVGDSEGICVSSGLTPTSTSGRSPSTPPPASPWPAPPPDPRRRHRQPPDPVAGRPDARAFRRRGRAAAELHVRDLENGSDTRIRRAEPNRGFPAISPRWTADGVQRRRAGSRPCSVPYC